MPDSAAEIVNLQVSLLGFTNKPEMRRIEERAAEDAEKGKRKITIRGYAGDLEAAVWNRAALSAGSVIAGPAIVEEWTSTMLILPDQSATVDEYGNLIIKRVDT